MKIASLSGSPRESVGKKDASQLRQDYRVSGVMYGTGSQEHFSVSELEITKLVVNPDVFQIKFEFNGKTHDCVIQEIQFHPVTDRVIHLDLLQVIEGKPMRVELPVRTTGVSPGVMNGGRIQMLFRRIPVRGLAADLPEEILVNIDSLDIGDNARVGDIDVPNCQVLLNDSTLLVAVKRTRAAMSADAEVEEENSEDASDDSAA